MAELADSIATEVTRTAAPVPHRIRVFIAEDHRITLLGLRHLIESAGPGMQVVGTAHTRTELLEHPLLGEADLVLLDLDLAGQDSSLALADLQRRCAGHVLILTASDDTTRHQAVVRQGVRGVVHKCEAADVLLRAIRKVHEGEIWLHRNLLGQVMGHLTGRGGTLPALDDAQRRIAGLTPREREIVQRMVRSAGTKLIAVASELGLSEHTLRNHLTTVYAKLGVRGRLELHVFATEHGLGAPDGSR